MPDPARAIFDRFRALPHSEQIATPYTLAGIMVWARRQPKGIALDYGIGLGTVTATLVTAAPDLSIMAVERDARFGRGDTITITRRAFTSDEIRVPVFPSLSALLRDPGCVPFSLVVIDDGADTYDLGTLAMRGLAPRAVLILEGNRPCERGAVTAMLAHVGRAHVVATWRPKDRSKGYTVVLCDATFGERLWFLGVRVREGLLDQIARWRGIRPGWRRRDSDPHA